MPKEDIGPASRPQGGARVESERRLVRKWVLLGRVPTRDVDDVVQESLLAIRKGAALRAADASSDPGVATAILRGVVLRQVANYWRTQQRSGVVGYSRNRKSLPIDGMFTFPSPEVHFLARAPLGILRQGLLRLRAQAPCLHAVLVAYELNEVPMPQVAETLGIRVNTAWNRLRLGRAALREHFHRWVALERGGKCTFPPSEWLAARDELTRSGRTWGGL
ncbi:MAG: hypothetical protein IPK82_06550 [Polyangiaceae bacterium]|nr:hypothetical protein [Polyangiaceae bacterium]